VQCVAVCCSVLWCVVVCCSVLQCVAVCRSVLQCAAVCCSVLQCAAVCGHYLQRCNVYIPKSQKGVLLQCVAVHCSVLHCVAIINNYARWTFAKVCSPLNFLRTQLLHHGFPSNTLFQSHCTSAHVEVAIFLKSLLSSHFTLEIL